LRLGVFAPPLLEERGLGGEVHDSVRKSVGIEGGMGWGF